MQGQSRTVHMSDLTARLFRFDLWHPHWRGHLFLFDPKPGPAISPGASLKLLLIFALLEFALGPRLWILSPLGLPDPDPWIRIIALLFLSLILIRFFGRVPLTDLGLYPLKLWSFTEKSYLVQLVIITNVVFISFQTSEIGTIFTHPQVWLGGLSILIMTMVWGFYQELVYRGLLQTALTRRIGSLGGIILCNLLFTFGPLHFYHFHLARNHPAHLWIFAAIFATGLFFSVLKQRSGNLWIVGILHGLGDCYLVGIPQILALMKHG